MMEIVGLVTARGGSKSVPRKNVQLLAGKPLIAWTIEAARCSRRLSRVIVSTDDPEIAHIAREYGAEVPFLRPPELAQDHSSHISVVEHALYWLKEHEGAQPDYLMLLQPTSPLRTSEDIEAAISIAEAHQAIAVVSVAEAAHHPYLSKRILEDGTLADLVSTDIPYLRRQALPDAYCLNGAIYLNRRQSLLHDRVFWPQGSYAYIMPHERSLDIDSPWDFYLAGLILGHGRETQSA
jgi:CMP-N,N'-diacetyllegionaminic acid synthase